MLVQALTDVGGRAFVEGGAESDQYFSMFAECETVRWLERTAYTVLSEVLEIFRYMSGWQYHLSQTETATNDISNPFQYLI